MRYTKEQRQQIIREFAIRHNGHYNPKLFVEEVRTTGQDHPAYGWFTWDKDKAAEAHLLWEAREFAKDLRVTFTVEEIGRNKSITVREVAVPFVLSPMLHRDKGGGYVVSDPNNPEHMAELCKQAATDLDRWLRRYEAALIFAGGSAQVMRKQLATLEAKAPQEEAA